MRSPNNRTIILVEDEEQQRDIIKILLEVEGCHVYSFDSAKDVLAGIDKIEPSLFISDVKMKEMDGFAFFEKIRSQKKFHDAPFIFITAYNDNAFERSPCFLLHHQTL